MKAFDKQSRQGRGSREGGAKGGGMSSDVAKFILWAIHHYQHDFVTIIQPRAKDGVTSGLLATRESSCIVHGLDLDRYLRTKVLRIGHPLNNSLHHLPSNSDIPTKGYQSSWTSLLPSPTTCIGTAGMPLIPERAPLLPPKMTWMDAVRARTFDYRVPYLRNKVPKLVLSTW